MARGYEVQTSDRGVARVALVTFASYRSRKLAESEFGLKNSCQDVIAATRIPFDCLYFLPKDNDWYHGGVQEIGDDLETSARAIAAMIARYDATIFVGNSMGGFASLVLGAWAGATRIIAVSPQTRLDNAFRASLGDARWAPALDQTNRRFRDRLVSVAAAWTRRGVETSATVLVGADTAPDMAQAEQLRGLDGIDIEVMENVGHEAARAMRKSGALVARLTAAVEQEAAREQAGVG